jgi:mono/diheme cytochrome c family protein
LYDLPEDDGFAIAKYIESLRPVLPSEETTAALMAFAMEREWDPDNPPSYDDPGLQAGVDAFDYVCANCHKIGGTTVPLAITSTVRLPEALNVMNIIFDGVRPPLGARDHSMPEFGASLTDQDIANVLRFVRVQYTNLPVWENLEEIIAEKRENW